MTFAIENAHLTEKLINNKLYVNLSSACPWLRLLRKN